MNSLTYKRTKRLIELKIKAGELTEEYCLEMKDNLDLFRLGKRITPEEYAELMNMLSAGGTE